MNRLYLLTMSVGLTVFFSASGPSIRAQNTGASTGAVAEVCPDSSLPVRPTLKVRQPDSARTDASDSKKTETVKCEQSSQSSSGNQNSVAIQFDGLHAFSESDVLRRFRQNGMTLADRLINPELADKAAASIKELLETKGYLHASVQSVSDETLRAITFQVHEGTRLPLAAIRFEGPKIFSTAELETKTRECLKQLRLSQNAYEQFGLEYCLRSVSNFVGNQGYLQAKFAEPRREIAGDGIVVSVDVKEGGQFRLGEIKIEGSDRFSVDHLRRMLLLQQGEVASGDRIAKWLFEDLKELYEDLGYIEYTAQPVPEFKTVAGSKGEGIVDFKVTIEEGREFRVESIKLKGANLPSGLLEYSSLRPGDIYRPKAFQDFVDKLSATGLFELIDKDKDSKFNTNDEEALVSITLKINKALPVSTTPKQTYDPSFCSLH